MGSLTFDDKLSRITLDICSTASSKHKRMYYFEHNEIPYTLEPIISRMYSTTRCVQLPDCTTNRQTKKPFFPSGPVTV